MKPRKTERRWKIIDHTADIRVEVYGTDLSELFVNAAIALTELLGVSSPLPAEKDVELALDSQSLDELLVDWLREVLFYNQARGWIVETISMDHLSDTSLKAAVSFGIRPEEEEPELEIKAVTYHGLSIEKSDQGYSAKILFDI